ncbi:MAG: hypothetical protein HYY11_03505 [Candidatus Methylomirabilis oxyfera]|nr:hypothetical protein [Candidatus Methylomirabilis oxyfera]
MTHRGFITMGIRPTRRVGRRLLAAALLSSMALVVISARDVHARKKDGSSEFLFRCLDFPDKTGQCPDKPNGSTRSAESRALAPTATLADPAATTAQAAPPPPGLPKPVTPGVKTPPPVQVRKPDLVPIPNPNASAGPAGFCTRDPAGKLVVHVKNQGVIAAPVSTTVVHLWKSGHAVRRDILPTPVIPVGGMVSLPGVEIPAGAFPPDLVFTITVDGQSKVDESDEMNNRVEDKCVS